MQSRFYFSSRYFNPLPRKEGDRDLDHANIGTILNFNPLPRKEGDEELVPTVTWITISIHSLVKRETLITANHNWI